MTHIFGQRGSGKTTLTKKIAVELYSARDIGRVIILDNKEQWSDFKLQPSCVTSSTLDAKHDNISDNRVVRHKWLMNFSAARICEEQRAHNTETLIIIECWNLYRDAKHEK